MKRAPRQLFFEAKMSFYRLKRAFSPLRFSPQDHCLSNAAVTVPQKCVLVTQFRGARKSWSAQRIAARSSFWGCVSIAYINCSEHDSREFEQFMRCHSSLPEAKKNSEVAATVFKNATFVALFSACGTLLKWLYAGRFPTLSEAQNLFDTTQAVWTMPWSWSLLLDPTVFFPFAWVLYRMLLSIRVKTIFIDGICNIRPTAGRSEVNRWGLLQSHLASIEGTASCSSHRFVVISSNEGLGACFPDANSDGRISVSFPVAESDDFERTLRDFGHSDATCSIFRQLEKLALPKHLSHSMVLYSLLKGSELELLVKGNGSELRVVLERVAMGLDLASDSTFLHASLGLSHRLDGKCRTNLLSLVQRTLPSSSSTEWQGQVPEQLPSRLALSWMLVASGTRNTAFAREVYHKLHTDRLPTVNVSSAYYAGIGRVQLLKNFIGAPQFYVAVTLPGERNPFVVNVANTLKKDLSETVYDLKKAVLKELPNRLNKKDVVDLTVYPPAAKKGNIAYGTGSSVGDVDTPLENAPVGAPYHIVVS